MFTKQARIILIVLAVVCWSATAWGDLKDFIDSGKQKSYQKACDNQVHKCLGKCGDKGGEGCKVNCWNKGAKCSRAALDKAVQQEKMPKDARKYAEKLMKKQAAGMKKCTKKADKCSSKCPDKRKCFNACEEDWLDCTQDVQKKYSVRNKKMKKKLKGKTP